MHLYMSMSGGLVVFTGVPSTDYSITLQQCLASDGPFILFHRRALFMACNIHITA